MWISLTGVTRILTQSKFSGTVMICKWLALGQNPGLLAQSLIFTYVNMLPENWVRLLLRIKPKAGRRKDLQLSASKEDVGELSQSNVSLSSKIGECSAKGTSMFQKGLEQRIQHRIGQRRTESKI